MSVGVYFKDENYIVVDCHEQENCLMGIKHLLLHKK